MDENIKRLLDQTIERIKKNGWTGIGIGADTESTPPFPSYTYSVGLTSTYEHPELVIFGVPFEIAMGILGDAAKRVRDGTLVCTDGGSDDRLVQGFPVVFRTVPADAIREHLRIADVLEHDAPLSALQIIWPDPNGKFPWENGADPHYALMQPLLFQTTH